MQAAKQNPSLLDRLQELPTDTYNEVVTALTDAEWLRRTEARSYVLPFCQYIDKDYEVAPHLELIAYKLLQVERYIETKGKEGIGRLILNLPPRHGKTQTVTKRWPAFLLGNYPDMRIALVGYSDEFAGDFSRAVRNLCRGDHKFYSKLFPDIRVHPQSSAVQRWSLDGQDIDDPNVVSVGINGALTGRGFNLIVIDDPIRNRAEAESRAVRESVKEAYRGTIRPRLEPGGAIVIIMTRWHEDDLVGYLLEQQAIGEGETWEVVNLAAVAEEGDPLGRKVGEALWGLRFDTQSLALTRLGLGSYDFDAQYQGHPKPPGGHKIKRAWFKIIPKLPARLRTMPDGSPPAEKLDWFRYWDLALSSKNDGDYFASARVAVDVAGNIYIANMVRDRLDWPEQKKVIKDMMLAERELGVRHGIEKALHGLSAVQDFLADPELAGVSVVGVDTPSIDKLSRALAWIARAEGGKVFLLEGAWIGDFLDEASDFTGSGKDKHDDQIDTISGGYNELTAGGLARMTEYYKQRAIGGGAQNEGALERSWREALQVYIDNPASIPGMPRKLNPFAAGSILADVAAKLIDEGREADAAKLLELRKRLGI